MAWFIGLLVGIVLGVSVQLVLRRRRRLRRLASRRVEAPNSSFTSPLVRQAEQRDRWMGIHLGELHPLNRKEVERLLSIVTSSGVMALSERERVFLEQLARDDAR
ncbi:MAG: hypothetical protein R3E10_14270 [Gemmatimonadota bacterium]